MPVQQQDYIMRQIALLRQFAARLASRRSELELEEALQLSFHLQEKLLPLPPADFLQLDLSAQIEALRQNETPAAAHEKCLAYAGLLAETAALYDFKGRHDLAEGARQMALHAALCAALESPHEPAPGQLIVSLAGQLSPESLHAPVAELLAAYRQQT